MILLTLGGQESLVVGTQHSALVGLQFAADISPLLEPWVIPSALSASQSAGVSLLPYVQLSHSSTGPGRFCMSPRMTGIQRCCSSCVFFPNVSDNPIRQTDSSGFQNCVVFYSTAEADGIRDTVSCFLTHWNYLTPSLKNIQKLKTGWWEAQYQLGLDSPAWTRKLSSVYYPLVRLLYSFYKVGNKECFPQASSGKTLSGQGH